jgi:hypothetical protein
MLVVAQNKQEALGLALSNMPNDSSLSAHSDAWIVSRTMENVWTVYIRGAGDKATKMGHAGLQADRKWYDSPLTAAEAITYGHHTAYGQAI